VTGDECARGICQCSCTANVVHVGVRKDQPVQPEPFLLKIGCYLAAGLCEAGFYQDLMPGQIVAIGVTPTTAEEPYIRSRYLNIQSHMGHLEQ